MQVKQNSQIILKTVVLSLAVVFAGSMLYCEHTGIKIGINATESMPKSVYFYKQYDNCALVEGDKVIFPLFVDVPKDYPFKKGSHFIKIVACTEGSYLSQKEVEGGLETYCDGRLIAVAKSKDGLGNELTQFRFNGAIPEDMYFMNTLHRASFDSRYYGLVHKKQITGMVVGEF
jgi:type IV secretory pathway protease TraF